MEAGDLVKAIRGRKMTGVIVGFEFREAAGGGYSVKMPVVLWADKRCFPTMPDLVDVVNESR